MLLNCSLLFLSALAVLVCRLLERSGCLRTDSFSSVADSLRFISVLFPRHKAPSFFGFPLLLSSFLQLTFFSFLRCIRQSPSFFPFLPMCPFIARRLLTCRIVEFVSKYKVLSFLSPRRAILSSCYRSSSLLLPLLRTVLLPLPLSWPRERIDHLSFHPFVYISLQRSSFSCAFRAPFTPTLPKFDAILTSLCPLHPIPPPPFDLDQFLYAPEGRRRRRSRCFFKFSSWLFLSPILLHSLPLVRSVSAVTLKAIFSRYKLFAYFSSELKCRLA